MRIVDLASSRRVFVRSFWWWSFTIIVTSVYLVQRIVVFLGGLFSKKAVYFDRRPLQLAISILIGLQLSCYYFSPPGMRYTSTLGQSILYWLILISPRKTMSTLMGKLCKTPIQSSALRNALYSWWCRHYGVITSEILEPLDHYLSLDAFFTRRVDLSTRKNFQSRDSVHPKDKEAYRFFFSRERLIGVSTPYDGTLLESTVLSSTFLFSPADSILTSYGVFSSPYMQTLTCKGLIYNAADLLAPDAADDKICLCKSTVLHWAVFYLSPGDYHRFHAPCDMLITRCKHAHGDLLPVNSLFLPRIKGLLAANERVILSGSYRIEGHANSLYFAYVAVGALNVGNIELRDPYQSEHASRISTVAKDQDKHVPYEYSTGEEVGQFHFGSTIVLVYEVPITHKVVYLAEEQKPVRVGDEIALITKQ